jgi:hypothetical protein
MLDQFASGSLGVVVTKKEPSTRTERKIDVISKLRAAVTGRESWEEIESLLDELEKLI